MGFCLKEGVILFKVCGSWYIFPSRKAKDLPPVILSASEETADVLLAGEDRFCAIPGAETENKLRRLAGAGFVEEY